MASVTTAVMGQYIIFAALVQTAEIVVLAN